MAGRWDSGSWPSNKDWLHIKLCVMNGRSSSMNSFSTPVGPGSHDFVFEARISFRISSLLYRHNCAACLEMEKLGSRWGGTSWLADVIYLLDKIVKQTLCWAFPGCCRVVFCVTHQRWKNFPELPFGWNAHLPIVFVFDSVGSVIFFSKHISGLHTAFFGHEMLSWVRLRGNNAHSVSPPAHFLAHDGPWRLDPQSARISDSAFQGRANGHAGHETRRVVVISDSVLSGANRSEIPWSPPRTGWTVPLS